MEAQGDRRIHGVGNGKTPKQPGTAAAVAFATGLPKLLDACNIFAHRLGQRLRRGRAAAIHAAMAAQRLEAGMHFRGDGARFGTTCRLCRPTVGVRKAFGEILEYGQRFPDRDVAVPQHRHLAGWRILGDTGSSVLPVKRNADLLEGDVVVLQEQPGPQRP